MLAKRLIACLDVAEGRVVKGVQFVNLRDMGDPVELGVFYAEQGIDELVYLDISASVEGRRTFTQAVERLARYLRIPFTVGGGIRTIEDVRRLLEAGADKVSINTAALTNPELISAAAAVLGSQSVVVAVDTKWDGHGYRVYSHGGRHATSWEAVPWCQEAERFGAGEILLTAIGRDGTRQGYDLTITRAVAEAVRVPVIASGGAGRLEDFYAVLTTGGADAALAAGLFHEGVCSPAAVKAYLAEKGLSIRL